MGKHNQQKKYNSGRHGAADHDMLPIWNGFIQATNADELQKEYKEYDICVFLTRMTVPEEVPFTFGVEGPKVKSKIIYFHFADRHAPDDGPFWDWLVKTLRDALQVKDTTIGIACMGGHGRTGTVIATLYGKYLAEQNKGVPKENPIEAIRDLIGCDEEVESKEQEMFVYEQTGFPPPAKGVASDLQYVSKGGGFYGESFAWWDKDGNGVKPISLEPKDLSHRKFVRNPIVGGPAVEVTERGGWLIPIKLDSSGQPTNIPDSFCRTCSGAMAYKMPYHKGSHLTCYVCPILAEMGATRQRPQPKKVEPPKQLGDGKKVNTDDLCDYCGKEFNFNLAKFCFLGGETMQFCDVQCKEAYLVKVGAKEDGGVSKDVQAICDAYVDGDWCSKPNAVLYSIIDGKVMHFCTWEHLLREKERRQIAAKAMADLNRAKPSVVNAQDAIDTEVVGGSPTPKAEEPKPAPVVEPTKEAGDPLPAGLIDWTKVPKDEAERKSVLDRLISAFGGVKGGTC